MCIQTNDFDSGKELEESLDDNLKNLFRRFIDLNESEAGEQMNIDDLKKEFLNLITIKLNEFQESELR